MVSSNLTVVIPGYNPNNAELEECLRSVLSSLDKNGEVIYIDDKSPTEPMCLTKIAIEDARLKIIRLRENRGQAYARNVGIRNASGQFVTFADQDDQVVPGWYDEGLRFLEGTGNDIVICGVKTVWKKERLQKVDVLSRCDYGVLDGCALSKIYRKCLFNYPWNKIYRKSFLLENNLFYEEKSVPREDEVFNLRCAAALAKWCAIESVGYIYNHYSMSTLGRYRKYNDESNDFVSEGWNCCRDKLPNNGELDGIGVYSSRQRFLQGWKNIWRPHSPYNSGAKWQWLNENCNSGRKFGGLVRAWYFCSMCVYQIFRKYLYFSFIRRILIKRLYPNASDLS